MSTASTATASAERDLNLEKELNIVNCIYLLAATQGNGTPLCPTSFQEEDVVELYIGLVHLEGCYGFQILKWSSCSDLAPK